MLTLIFHQVLEKRESELNMGKTIGSLSTFVLVNGLLLFLMFQGN